MAKRIFDILASGTGLLILSVPMLIISILIKLDSPGPVLFKQERIGKNKQPFRIYKFRTMHTNAEQQGGQLTVGRDPRITRVGHLLRKSKLDELPQLINVLKGDMSLVGPRPEVPKYVALYTPEQQRILSVRPGITDLASIEFRDENELLQNQQDPESYYINTIMPKKLELNQAYIARQSLAFDVYVIFKTLYRVLLPASDKSANG